jgi:hypothetical protein
MTSLPQHFTVGTSVNSTAGDGTLTVAPGTLVLRLDLTTRRRTGIGSFVHEGEQLTLLIARLLPFSNTRVVLEHRDAVAYATLPSWSRSRLRTSLQRAGFEVSEHASWLHPTVTKPHL